MAGIDNSGGVKLIAILALLTAFFFADTGSAAKRLPSDEENCLMCHRHRRMARIDETGKKHEYHVNQEAYVASIHGRVVCRGCHDSIKEIPHRDVKPVDCSNNCHLKPKYSSEAFSHKWAVKLFNESVHAPKPGEPEWAAKHKPDCKYCHYEPSYRKPEGLPLAAFERCKNCHEAEEVVHAIDHVTHRLRVKTSRTHEEITELCSKNCHEDKELMARFKIDQKHIASVETYKESLHYRVNQFGFEKGATCIDCHAPSSFHDIRKSTDNRSHLYKDVRYQVCRQENCHPGATKRIAAIDPHIAKGKGLNPLMHYMELGLLVLTALSLIALISLTLLESFARWRKGDALFFRWKRKPLSLPLSVAREALAKIKGKEYDPMSYLGTIDNLHRYVPVDYRGDYRRYSVHIRINHMLTIITFLIAVVTGLPIYFHNTEWARAANALMGGIEVSRIIHRVNAIFFILNMLYHLVVIAAGTLSRAAKGKFDFRRTMFPTLKDAMDAKDDILYFIDRRETRPRMEKFGYKQKFHYFALIWGNTWLILSGLSFWFPTEMVQILPFPDITFNFLRLIHAEESILATLVVVFWHGVNVHVVPGRFPMQWVFLTGNVSRDYQIEEHFLEYERLVKSGEAECEEYKLIKKALAEGGGEKA